MSMMGLMDSAQAGDSSAFEERSYSTPASHCYEQLLTGRFVFKLVFHSEILAGTKCDSFLS